ncbi:perlucin [Dendroctonus ponderosae]
MLKLYFIVSLGAFLLISYGSSSLMLPLNNTYYVSEYETTFLHALAGCKMIDMDLLRIESATESLNLYNLMDAAGLAVSGRAYWMGGAYLSDDSWVWIETGGVLSYTRWGANEPNMTGSGTHCLQLGKDNDGKSSINWQSRLCITSRYYICEVNS